MEVLGGKREKIFDAYTAAPINVTLFEVLLRTKPHRAFFQHYMEYATEHLARMADIQGPVGGARVGGHSPLHRDARTVATRSMGGVHRDLLPWRPPCAAGARRVAAAGGCATATGA